MLIKKILPNILTILRIIITIILSLSIIYANNNITKTKMFFFILILTAFIYFTDIMDGKLARRWNCCTTFGAKLDIATDLFYIVSQDLILIYQGNMKSWVLIIILIEFFSFFTCSFKNNKIQQKGEIKFDKSGRIAALYYYIMPLMYIIMIEIDNIYCKKMIGIIIESGCIILTVIAVSSKIVIKEVEKSFIKIEHMKKEL